MINELIAGFDAEVFFALLQSKCSSFSDARSGIPVKKEFAWESAERLGIVKTLAGPGGANMPLLVVRVKLHDGETLKERTSRMNQFKFAKQVLDQAMSNPSPGVEGVVTQGLFVFYDDDGNFRLSLVYGKAEGTKLVWSTAKRLSFYVEAGGGNKTFRDRMALPWSSFDQLKEAFSVEKLTKEFYGRLFAWYQWALSDEMNVTYPNDPDRDDDDRDINEHIIRLITRMMFVWFIKHKGLVPNDLFDADKLTKILKDFNPTTGDNYYRAILQNLFFATLNSEIPERAFATQSGDRSEHFDIKTLYRYPKEFAIPEANVLELFGQIPFLNGGLFECLDRGKNYYDGFSRNSNRVAKVPNCLFFDPDKGLIPLLRQYNFTVEENSPGDEEVALDPELLGKVFENLLGAYNPETKVAARNATGSFYTPREIVNYMVDESLIAHLIGKCGEENADAIRKLFTDGERPTDKKLCDAMDKALVTAKILDPACGSGAFPMGILLRMVELLRILRNLPEDQSVYDLKLELIENCIYGSDIQCIAVQISKLRFFISLVCEQKPTKSAKDNYGIHTLPNLETKFVAADSLIGLPKGGNELPMKDVETMKKELWAVRHRHFLARSYQEKKDLRKEDKKLRTELAKALEQGGGFDTASAKLMAAWDPYDQNTSAPFSDLEWMFNVKDGFDVVIGNPPYIQLQSNQGVLADLYEGIGYKTFGRTADIYCLFYERGFNILRPCGHLCYITSNQWMRTAYGKKLRGFFCEQTRPKELLDMGEGVFEATTNTNILLVENNTTINTFSAASVTDRFSLDGNSELQWILLTPSSDPWIVSCASEQAIVSKMKVVGTPLKEWNIQINYGVKTGFNEAFIIDGAMKDNLVTADANSLNIIKPVLRGRDIKRYKYDFADLWMISTFPVLDIDIDDYPSVKSHLKSFGKKLKQTGEVIGADDKGKPIKSRKKTGNAWFETQDQISCHLEFEKEKISWGNLCQSAQFSLVNAGLYISAPSPLITPANRYLLAILNSRLGDYFIRGLGVIRSGGYFEYKPMFVEQLPVPIITEPEQRPFAELVDRILAVKKADPNADTSKLEDEIDELVYDLYGLAPEEKEIVKASVSRGGAAVVEDDEEEAGETEAVTAPEPKPSSPKVAPRRRKKTALPPSLPGWD